MGPGPDFGKRNRIEKEEKQVYIFASVECLSSKALFSVKLSPDFFPPTHLPLSGFVFPTLSCLAVCNESSNRGSSDLCAQ